MCNISMSAPVDSSGNVNVRFSAPNASRNKDAAKSILKVKTLEESVRSTEKKAPRVMQASLAKSFRSMKNILHTAKHDGDEKGDDGNQECAPPPPSVSDMRNGFKAQKMGSSAKNAGRSIRNMANSGVGATGRSMRNLGQSTGKSFRNVAKLVRMGVTMTGAGKGSAQKKNDTAGHEATHIKFDSVHIREYQTKVDINPGCSKGVAMGIGWEYTANAPVNVDEYEAAHPPRKVLKELKLSPKEREARLKESGVTPAEMARAVKETNIARGKRKATLENMRQSATHEKIEGMKRKFKKIVGLRKSDEKEQEALWKGANAFYLQNC